MAGVYRCLYQRRLCVDEQYVPENAKAFYGFMRNGRNNGCAVPILNPAVGKRYGGGSIYANTVYSHIYASELLGFPSGYSD